MSESVFIFLILIEWWLIRCTKIKYPCVRWIVFPPDETVKTRKRQEGGVAQHMHMRWWGGEGIPPRHLKSKKAQLVMT